MEEITIERVYTGWRVVEGRVPRSRLMFYAAGLAVFVHGEGAYREYDTLANIAMNECLARHIPSASLRSVFEEKKPPVQQRAEDEDGNAQKPLL
jgi:hypothetical protein